MWFWRECQGKNNLFFQFFQFLIKMLPIGICFPKKFRINTIIGAGHRPEAICLRYCPIKVFDCNDFAVDICDAHIGNFKGSCKNSLPFFLSAENQFALILLE